MAPARKCTCLVDTESDSDDDQPTPTPPACLLVSASALASALDVEAAGGAPLSLRRKISGQRDPIATSTALHNSEALRQATSLANVFCACYDVDTVLTLVQRRERCLSPMQTLLLQRESLAAVFRFATAVPERRGAPAATPEAPDADHPHRRAFVATEIILRFYLKVIAWHGAPRAPPAAERSPEAPDETPVDSAAPLSPSRRFSAEAPPVSSPPHHHHILMFGSGVRGRGRGSARHIGAGSGGTAHGSGGLDVVDSLEIRGYVLRLEDLGESEWQAILAQLFHFLCVSRSRNMVTIAEAPATMDAPSQSQSQSQSPADDSVLVANMCRITKHLAVLPSVLPLLLGVRLQTDDGPRAWIHVLVQHAYSPEIATLVHGLMHLLQRRQLPLDEIMRSVVQTLAGAAPQSFSASTAQLFLAKRARVHERLSGCAEIATKVLLQQFPNTFRYYIQTKVQLASFESVEPFERELFPPRVPPSDASLHTEVKSAVLAALLGDPETLLRLADLSLAEIRFLDAYHASPAVSIPPVLVLDVMRCAIECSLHERTQLELFLPALHRLLDSLCASINFRQHMSTISEFASRDCFSDSDSDDSEASGLSLGDDDRERPLSGAARTSKEEQGTLPSRILPIDDDCLAKKDAIGAVPAPLCLSPTSGRQIMNHRPLTSTLLVMHVVEFLDAVIRMGIDSLDNRMTRLGLSTSLSHLFERYPSANVLHCRLLRLFLHLFDRHTTGRVNNPLLRSVFRPPNSIQEFILKKLHKSAKTHAYDAHLSILGVKIDKICSAPTLQQELIRQYCGATSGWADFCASLVARHYQQVDALDDTAVPSISNAAVSRRSSDGFDDVYPLSRPSSSSIDFLTEELQPFRRLPMEREGFGSSSNRAMGTEAVRPSDMLKSRAQSQFPQSINDILRSDTTTSFEAIEDDDTVAGVAYQKRAKWVKVQLKLDKATCILVCQDLPMPVSQSTTGQGAPTVASPIERSSSKKRAALSASKIKQLWEQHKPQWAQRPKKYVVCHARKWIAFGRSLKNPDVGAFGFQVDVFDRIREEDQTLTFVTRSEKTRTQWFDALEDAVYASRTLRQSFPDADEEANTMLVKCVATRREGTQMVYLAIPDVHVLGPLISSSFTLKSDVPEEIPFWGTFQGAHGVSKYCSLFKQCLRVVSVQEKRVYASGYSVIVEFDATLEAVDARSTATQPVKSRPSGQFHLHLEIPHRTQHSEQSVTCSFTDTYQVNNGQIIGLTRTIADSEKLLKLLCDDND
ncbi:hypothetical protein P43SY_009582 [Pythium insidiosum]|uniref:PH domain-containing protein n=1 Tax=Pythium insidiosum TaxID=114742 RepID=A0AAD5LLP8_PYTIN|nr:hypothetical protein P43SY_009582 [Pythium insidiosum]